MAHSPCFSGVANSPSDIAAKAAMISGTLRTRFTRFDVCTAASADVAVVVDTAVAMSTALNSEAAPKKVAGGTLSSTPKTPAPFSVA